MGAFVSGVNCLGVGVLRLAPLWSAARKELNEEIAPGIRSECRDMYEPCVELVS